MNGVAAPRIAVDSAPAPDVQGGDALRPRRSVSVVMVVYMTGEALQESLACVLADPLVDEFVIVDNGSSPQEAERLRLLAERDDRVVLRTGHGNVGFARGANLGARTAKGDLIVFLNPDAFLQAGCIAALAREIEGRAVPCIVGGRVLNPDRTEQRGARRGDITPVSALLSMSGLARSPALRKFEVHWEGEALPEQAAPAPTISGACFCMRREDFEAVDGFDEGYFLHVEDVDLCWRVREMGGEVLFHPKAEVIHIGGASQTSRLKVEFHKGVGLARYFAKRAGPLGRWAAWALAPLVIAAAVARPLLRRTRR
ncbi:glycosyltransferase family 2 protein [Phenylobacterium sp.]|uniref:glycosyltransferase family 2 protein n=1 Tax=Phenylobacterium sp. TaxID=1871053 RepID=UPI0025CFCC78|nr:glycosyltransferase family 2 protein [Phenylobacterium sp.]MBX3482696.1 glycosyltransferase family 2 protein [Phenylobacterium sp.]